MAPAIVKAPYVFGHMYEDELHFLEHIAADRRVLEIGSYYGRSTYAMAAAGAEVWCLDTFRGGDDLEEGWFLPKFLENGHQLGLLNRLHIIVSPWEDMLPHLALEMFDILFYDARHDYTSCFEAGCLLAEGARQGAAILFHDYNSHFPGTMKAVQDISHRHGRRIIPAVGSLVGLEVL